MAKCDRRPFDSNAFPDAAVRRRIVSALLCGASFPPRRRLRPPLPPGPRRPGGGGSDRLRDLLLLEEARGVVAALRAGEVERRRRAAAEVRRMARGDPEARARLAAAGAVGPLVEMVVGPTEGDGNGDNDLEVVVIVEVLYALLNLGIGNDANKAAIIQSGALERILTLINSNPSPLVSEAIVTILLSLSALDSSKSLIGSSSAVPFLITIFQNHHQQQAKNESLRALFNLSLSPSNAIYLTSHNLVPALLSSLEDMDLGDRSLAILSNLVSSLCGRMALSSSPDAYPILMDLLSWTDSPKCQEKAAYILMVMVHKADAGDRAAMLEAGIVSSLLELMLVGSALAQKRAARVLECLRVEKGKQVPEGFEESDNGIMVEVGGGKLEEGAMSEERRAVRELVRQSLQCNMRRIVSRANLQYNFAPSDRLLLLGGTSKRLPL